MESDSRILAFGAGGVSLGIGRSLAGFLRASGRERQAFSAKSVANTHMDADWRIVQKLPLPRAQKYRAGGVLGCAAGRR